MVNGTTLTENVDVETSNVLPKSVSKSHDNLTLNVERRRSRTSLTSSKASLSKIVSVGTSVHS